LILSKSIKYLKDAKQEKMTIALHGNPQMKASIRKGFYGLTPTVSDDEHEQHTRANPAHSMTPTQLSCYSIHSKIL
jgi:hypothetical protein